MGLVKLKGWREEHVEIKISESDLLSSTVNLIRQNFKLTNVDGIDDEGRMYENAEYATSHSWIQKEDRGVPTESQREALTAISFLRGMAKCPF